MYTAKINYDNPWEIIYDPARQGFKNMPNNAVLADILNINPFANIYFAPDNLLTIKYNRKIAQFLGNGQEFPKYRLSGFNSKTQKPLEDLIAAQEERNAVDNQIVQDQRFIKETLKRKNNGELPMNARNSNKYTPNTNTFNTGSYYMTDLNNGYNNQPLSKLQIEYLPVQNQNQLALLQYQPNNNNLPIDPNLNQNLITGQTIDPNGNINQNKGSLTPQQYKAIYDTALRQAEFVENYIDKHPDEQELYVALIAEQFKIDKELYKKNELSYDDPRVIDELIHDKPNRNYLLYHPTLLRTLEQDIINNMGKKGIDVKHGEYEVDKFLSADALQQQYEQDMKQEEELQEQLANERDFVESLKAVAKMRQMERLKKTLDLADEEENKNDEILHEMKSDDASTTAQVGGAGSPYKNKGIKDINFLYTHDATFSKYINKQTQDLIISKANTNLRDRKSALNELTNGSNYGTVMQVYAQSTNGKKSTMAMLLDHKVDSYVKLNDITLVDKKTLLDRNLIINYSFTYNDKTGKINFTKP